MAGKWCTILFGRGFTTRQKRRRDEGRKAAKLLEKFLELEMFMDEYSHFIKNLKEMYP